MSPQLLAKEKTDIDILTVAFRDFTQATQSLKASYQVVKSQVTRLNKELAEANEKLNQKVRELSRTRNYLNNTLDSMINGVIGIDLQERITIFNQAAEIITSYEAEEVVGLAYQKIFTHKNQFFTSLLRKTLQERRALVEERIFHRFNERVPLEIITNPVQDREGKIEGVLAVFRDISLVRKLQEEIRDKEGLAMTGEMAASVAHEIRNPLSGIEGFALLLKDALKEKKQKEWADNIIVGARNLDNLVTNLLNFARPLRPDFQEIELAKIIEDVLPFAFQEAEKKKMSLEVVKRFIAQKAKIKGDSDLLKQAFLNFILNSIQAMADEGRLTITIKQTNFSHINKFSRERKGGCLLTKFPRQVLIEFSDTGCGISAEEKKRIFRPFYTTKKKGYGLGMAITRRIIQSHEGIIQVESEKGKGTTFTVIFPLKEAED